MENLYETLNIDRNATKAEIKAAYRQLAAKYHPDINTSGDAEERFKAINLAHEVLSDFYLRLQYEQEYDAFHDIQPSTDIETNITEESVQEEQFDIKEDTFTSEEEPIINNEAKFAKDVEEKHKDIEEEQEEHHPIFPLKWKLALLATPLIILLGIGLLKVIVTLFNPQETQVVPNSTPIVETKDTSIKQVPKNIAIWELKRMAVAQPDQCISFIDSVKTTDQYQSEMTDIREKAVQHLPAKTAYFFETNECIRARNAFRMLLENQPNLKPHTRKKLDFYSFRCAIEAKDITLAMSILDEMTDRYTHQYSIMAARSQVLHHHKNLPKAALKAYQQARQLYEHQKIDAKFIEHWKPDYQAFTFATLLANEALALYELGDSDKTKAIAIRSINLDSTQILSYELIANQFKKEDNNWGACKYWQKAMENGSLSIADSLVKYCN